MKYQWKSESADHLTCEGQMYLLEVTINDDETVTGQMWREIPATFWEPVDMVVAYSAEYESSGAARAALEQRDTMAADWERGLEAHLERDPAELDRLERLANKD
jgi:hypothetical protein